jgi:G3E family GTPase
MNVDSQLAKQSNISGVKEMLNGCLCCILVGQMKYALEEILRDIKPDRIIIETSGSAFPAQVAWQINEMKKEGTRIYLDSIVTVVDAVNFRGYEDTSYTAKMQAQYTDLLLLNKWEMISERELDDVLDHLYELNPDTPKLKYSQDHFNIDLIFGTDGELFKKCRDSESFQLYTGNNGNGSHVDEVDTFEVRLKINDTDNFISKDKLQEFLSLPTLDKNDYYRVKGIARIENDEMVLINWAYGHYDLIQVTDIDMKQKHSNFVLRFTVVGTKDSGKAVKDSAQRIFKELSHDIEFIL